MSAAFVIASLVLALEPIASAIDLQWDAPPECPQARDVAERISALGVAADANAEVRGAITREGNRFRLALELATPAGRTRRTIDADRCELLAQSAAVVVAVALDPLATATTMRSETLPVSPSIPPPQASAPIDATTPVVEPRARPLVARRRPVKPKWILGARAVVGRGTLPTIDVGGELVVGPAWPHVRLELGALGLAPQRAEYPDRADVGTDTGIAAAIVRGCGALGPDRVQFELCAGIQLGAAIARGFGVRRPNTVGAPWLAFELGPRLVVRPHPNVGILLGVSAVLAALRPAFGIAERDDPADRLRAAAIRATIGLETRLP
jgi:hypothetical protein